MNNNVSEISIIMLFLTKTLLLHYSPSHSPNDIMSFFYSLKNFHFLSYQCQNISSFSFFDFKKERF